MASWTQAKKWLKEGKKIRRPIWSEESYWVLGSEKQRIDFNTGKQASVFLKQLEAKDWEIWEQPKEEEKLARWMHENYEEISKKELWKTQVKCQVKFDELPEKNKNVMIEMSKRLLKRFK